MTCYSFLAFINLKIKRCQKLIKMMFRATALPWSKVHPCLSTWRRHRLSNRQLYKYATAVNWFAFYPWQDDKYLRIVPYLSVNAANPAPDWPLMLIRLLLIPPLSYLCSPIRPQISQWLRTNTCPPHKKWKCFLEHVSWGWWIMTSFISRVLFCKFTFS